MRASMHACMHTVDSSSASLPVASRQWGQLEVRVVCNGVAAQGCCCAADPCMGHYI